MHGPQELNCFLVNLYNISHRQSLGCSCHGSTVPACYTAAVTRDPNLNHKPLRLKLPERLGARKQCALQSKTQGLLFKWREPGMFRTLLQSSVITPCHCRQLFFLILTSAIKVMRTKPKTKSHPEGGGKTNHCIFDVMGQATRDAAWQQCVVSYLGISYPPSNVEISKT